jgi:endonuclease YncB( thermonuclease family)
VELSRFLWRTAVGAFLLLASLAHGAGLDLDGRVVGVHDGDTVTLLDGERVQHRIRIAGIDAPERGQPFGTAARESLAGLVYGKHVAAHCRKRDRYGRDVCNLFVEARDVGLEQVRTGRAWWYRAYAREQSRADRASYEAAEAEARSAARGLWRDPSPQAPWAWRRQHAPGRKPASA